MPNIAVALVLTQAATGGVLLSSFLVELEVMPFQIGMLASISMLVNLLQPLSIGQIALPAVASTQGRSLKHTLQRLIQLMQSWIPRLRSSVEILTKL